MYTYRERFVVYVYFSVVKCVLKRSNIIKKKFLLTEYTEIKSLALMASLPKNEML